MDRGQLGALNYEIPLSEQASPSNQLAQRAAGGEQASGGDQFDLPKNLAVRRDKTEKLFNNYALLNNFAKSMREQGIDPFTPDYSQEGGGLPFQSYLDMDAGVRLAAQELANEYEAEKQLRPDFASGANRFNQGVDPTSELAYSDPTKYFSTEPLPFVKEANIRLNTPTYTTPDQARFNQAYLTTNQQRIDDMVASGELTPQEGEFQKSILQQNVKQTSAQQLIPRGGGGGRGGLTQEDLSRRAELIKQVKRGIITKDQTPINILKLAPGVEDVEYVNTGDKVGLNVWTRNQSQPSFVDLSSGAGEGEINAFLNRVEGQKNVPNEAVFSFDTRVDIPKSNVKPIVEDIKSKIKSYPNASETIEDIFPKLEELALSGELVTTGGDNILEIKKDIPYLWGDNKLVIKYLAPDKKAKTVKISDPKELEAFIEANANVIGSEFGGGFEQAQPTQQEQPQSIGKTVPMSKIQSFVGTPGYEGYTLEELIQYYKSQGYNIK